MKNITLTLFIMILLFSSAFCVATKQKAKTKPNSSPQNLHIRYYLTDMDRNPTVHFTVGESYYVYMSIQNMTQEAIPYKINSFSKPLFHFMALKSAAENFPARFNNQNESLQIPISTDKDTLLTYHAIIDDYQQIQFYAPGFYTIQIMPNIAFPNQYKKDWGTLKFEIECHADPNEKESDQFKDIFNNNELAPLLDKLKDLGQ
jgi:hypothetical protein